MKTEIAAMSQSRVGHLNPHQPRYASACTLYVYFTYHMSGMLDGHVELPGIKHKFIGLLSGGKDSCFNLMHCLANGHELVAIATLQPASGVGE